MEKSYYKRIFQLLFSVLWCHVNLFKKFLIPTSSEDIFSEPLSVPEETFSFEN